MSDPLSETKEALRAACDEMVMWWGIGATSDFMLRHIEPIIARLDALPAPVIRWCKTHHANVYVKKATCCTLGANRGARPCSIVDATLILSAPEHAPSSEGGSAREAGS